MLFRQLELTTWEFVLYWLLLNAGIGFVLGLIPLLFGYFTGKLKTGLFGILASTLGGAIAGIYLSIPLFAIFTWMIVRKPRQAAPAEDDISDPAN